MASREQDAESTTPSRPHSLGEACRSLGLDALGLRCPGCPLKALCTSEARWIVPRSKRPQRHLI